MDDRKAAQSMDFEQFHALRNRRRNKVAAPAATPGADGAEPGPDEAAPEPEPPVERVRLSETVGDFVEMHEVQLIVILLIFADHAYYHVLCIPNRRCHPPRDPPSFALTHLII